MSIRMKCIFHCTINNDTTLEAEASSEAEAPRGSIVADTQLLCSCCGGGGVCLFFYPFRGAIRCPPRKASVHS